MMNLTMSLQSNLIRLLDTSQTFGYRSGYSMTNENLAKSQTGHHSAWFTLLAGTLPVDPKLRRCRILDVRTSRTYFW